MTNELARISTRDHDFFSNLDRLSISRLIGSLLPIRVFLLDADIACGVRIPIRGSVSERIPMPCNELW